MKKLIIFLGPPGSGKGTQAQKLARKLDYSYLEMGQILREIPDPKTKATITSGRLVPAKIVLNALLAKIKPDVKGYIFDGFPRDLEQASKLESIRKKLNLEKPLIVLIKLADAEVVKRLANRLTCQKCLSTYAPFSPEYQEKICSKCQGKLVLRSDDRPETIKVRLKLYRQNLDNFLPFLRKNYEVLEIDGQPAIPEVQKQIAEKLEGKVG